MFTPMGLNTTDFSKCSFNSFISFIFSFLNIELFNRVFYRVVIPGICVTASCFTNRVFFCPRRGNTCSGVVK